MPFNPGNIVDLDEKKLKRVAIALCYSLIVFRILFVPLYNSHQARGTARGDGFSDANVHSASMYFHDFGFIKAKLLPVFHYRGDGDLSGTEAYTHYPPLPDLLGGVMSVTFDTKSDRVLRLLPAALSFVWLWLMFETLRLLIPNRRLALWAGLSIIVANYFTAFADSLHQGCYQELLKWAVLWCLVRYYQSGGIRKASQVALLFCFFLLSSLISFEPIPFLAIVLVGFRYVYERRLPRSVDLLILAALPLGFFLHFAQNVWHFGSVEQAILDLKLAGATRSGFDSMNWRNWWDLFQKFFSRIERFYLIPGWALIFLAPLGLKKLKGESQKSYEVSLVLLAAGLSWHFVMSQHALVHIFVVRHVVPFCAIAGIYGLAEWLARMKAHRHENKLWRYRAEYLLVVYIAVMAFTQHFLAVFLANGFLYPWALGRFG